MTETLRAMRTYQSVTHQDPITLTCYGKSEFAARSSFALVPKDAEGSAGAWGTNVPNTVPAEVKLNYTGSLCQVRKKNK